MFPRKPQREEWMDKTCHDLKHEHGAAKAILAEIRQAAEQKKKFEPIRSGNLQNDNSLYD